MTFSIRRLQAIVEKEWKDAIRNPHILLTSSIPLLISFLSNQKGSDDPTVFSTPILVAVSMTGAFVQATMVAEEKEKNTLRALMLSPASPLEVLLGKSFATSLLSIIVLAGCLALTGVPSANVGYTAVMTALLLAIFLALGTVIGLLSRTVSESSIVGLPIVLLFIFGPIFAPEVHLGLLMEVIDKLPSHHFIVALAKLAEGGNFADIWRNLTNLLVWTVVSCALCLFVYSRKRFDK